MKMENHSSAVILKRRQQVLHDKKWKKLLSRSRVFKYIPFVDFVFASGSMAIGNVKNSSDFDVIIGARYGRIFTTRFLLIFVSDVLRWRRKNLDHDATAADTLCLNHFVTEKALCLAPPHEEYWKLLYKRLVPLYGKKEAIQNFWNANKNWLGEIQFEDDLRFVQVEKSGLKFFLEKLLDNSFGNIIEKIVKKIQLQRIEKKLVSQADYKPRLIYTDSELELHLDTKRIETFSL